MEWNGMEWNGMECPVIQSFKMRGISFEDPCVKQLLSHHLFFSLFIELLLHSISYYLNINLFHVCSGSVLVSGWDDGKIRAFYPETGRIKFVIPDAHTERVRGWENSFHETCLLHKYKICVMIFTLIMFNHLSFFCVFLHCLCSPNPLLIYILTHSLTHTLTLSILQFTSFSLHQLTY